MSFLVVASYDLLDLKIPLRVLFISSGGQYFGMILWDDIQGRRRVLFCTGKTAVLPVLPL